MTLKFRWSDLETTDFHNLLEAVYDENIIVGIDDSFVACADPSEKVYSYLVSLKEGQHSGVPIYESLSRTGRDEQNAFELCGNTGEELLLTLAHCWYTSTRSMGYKPLILLAPLAHRTSHRA